MTGAGRRGPIPWLAGLLVVSLSVPVVAFAVRTVRSPDRGFGVPGLWGALYVSVVTATVSVALIALLGIPLGYLLARSHSRLSTAVGIVVVLPLAIPPLMSGIILAALVGPYTPLGRAFGMQLTDSMVGIVLAQCFVAAPFVVIAARSAFAAVDSTLLEHAATLGLAELARFWRVSLPVASHTIRGGLLLAWLRAFGEFGATVILAYHPPSLPVFTSVRFSATGIPATEAPTLLALLTAAVVAAVWHLPLRRTRRAPSVRRAVAPALPPPARLSCDLDVQLGDFQLRMAHSSASPSLAILGPSGSGKSLTLRALAGLLGPRVGSVCLGSADIGSAPPEERQIGYVPQGYGLVPHLPVWHQVCFGQGATAGAAAYWIDHFHLRGLEDRLPAELSGGQRQRVALAQALARHPALLLLDEPFSALDTPVRDELRAGLRQLQRQSGLSTVLVTHDPSEAALLADDVIVLVGGRVLQAGRRRQVFDQPASPIVARALGYTNLQPGRMGQFGLLDAGPLQFPVVAPSVRPGTAVTWSIRPEHVAVGPPGGHPAKVLDAVDLGPTTRMVLDLGGFVMEARGAYRENSPGSLCRVAFPACHVRVWPSSTHVGARAPAAA